MRLPNAPIRTILQKCIRMGITVFKKFHLGRYIVGYTFGNHVLRFRSRVAVKLNFRPYIRRYTSPNEKYEYSYPLIMHKPLSSINTSITILDRGQQTGQFSVCYLTGCDLLCYRQCWVEQGVKCYAC